ncbi:MAG: sigma-70 family RNA polymerase sigma factor [Bacteroidaceae bacterium]|nr:sigma-70 family RNA polymerase sigma factor [Bacteroidaceae bacterium]
MTREEIERLFRQHYTRMLRVARTLLDDEQESEDAVCDVFAALLHSPVRLTGETEAHYLMTAVRNRCLKRLRHAEVVRRMERQASAEMPDEAERAEDERLTDITEWVVGRLGEQEQRIFRLRFCDGCTYAEIAADLGLSRVAVWKHLDRIIRLLRNQFNQQQP